VENRYEGKKRAIENSFKKKTEGKAPEIETDRERGKKKKGELTSTGVRIHFGVEWAEAKT